MAASHLLMIRPVRFGYNAETAVNNAFQVHTSSGNAQEMALQEFDAFVVKLRQFGVDVTVVNDTPEPHTPDSIFPNNWISFHHDGSVVLYPMYAHNRRQERKAHVLQAIADKFVVANSTNLAHYEDEAIFLEGTGSMVLDRQQYLAYACISARTHTTLLETFCTLKGYKAIAFTALDQQGGQIYHTNVMMCVADSYVVICLESIADPAERTMVHNTIVQSGKAVVEISLAQMNAFAGNMLQVQNDQQQKALVMSTQAFEALKPEQVAQLAAYNPILHSSLLTIETNGGGSARCMMAEVYLPLRQPA
ncbi:MAG: amidinotransferase [Bacteroidetes bacterium]|nr:MAG: amidinotransferase [Bacteroidota bacterium]